MKARSTYPMTSSLMAILAVMGISFTMAFSACGTKTAQAETASVEIQTSANCGMCKRTIESALGETEGVASARLDLGDKKAYVTYDEAKTSPDVIKAAITGSGYDADDKECNKDAHDALPACCQKGAAPH